MKKGNSIPNIVYLAILTAITVIFWIFFSVFRIFTNQPTPSVASSILEPLNPDISLKLIDQVQTRVYIEENEIPETIINLASPSPSSSPTATETPLPSESPSASPEESPSPTATPTVTPTTTP